MKVAAIIFAIVFLTAVVMAALSIAYGIATLIVLAVRMFYPNFCLYRHPETQKEKERDHRQVKLVAIDFIMQEKIRQQREATRILHQQIHPTMPMLVAEEKKMSWELSEIAKPSVSPPPALTRDEDRRDLWCILRLRPGLPAHYLCRKLPSRSHTGLKTAWTVLVSERLLIPLDTAQRYAAMLDGAIVAPGNAAARILTRRDRQRREAQIPREIKSCEETQSAATRLSAF